MKKLTPLITVTSVHLVATIAALAVAIGYTMSRLTSAAPASLVEEIARGIFRLFRYPIPVFLLGLDSNLPRWLYDASFALNSFVWAVAIVWIAGKVGAMRKQKTA